MTLAGGNPLAVAIGNALAEPLAVAVGNPLADNNPLADTLAQSMIASRWLARIHPVTATSRTMFGKDG